MSTLFEQLQQRHRAAKLGKSEFAPAYTLILGELSRLKGTKDPWTQVLQTGNPSDEVTQNVLETMRKSEQERVRLGGAEDLVLMVVLDKEYPPAEIASEETIRQWLTDNVDFSSLQNKMMAIGLLKKEFGKSLDGKLASDIVKSM